MPVHVIELTVRDCEEGDLPGGYLVLAYSSERYLICTYREVLQAKTPSPVPIRFTEALRQAAGVEKLELLTSSLAKVPTHSLALPRRE